MGGPSEVGKLDRTRLLISTMMKTGGWTEDEDGWNLQVLRSRHARYIAMTEYQTLPACPSHLINFFPSRFFRLVAIFRRVSLAPIH